MADVTWDADSLKPKDVALAIRAFSAGGGRTLRGIEQVVQPDAGRWEITFGNIRIHTIDDVLQWREYEILIGGRAKTVLVPVHDGKRAPWLSTPGGAITATIFGSIARRATTGFISVTSGGTLEEGMHYSVGERLYRIREVISTVGSLYGVTFFPPAREAISNGATAEFRRPVCRCRLATDDQMNIVLEVLRYAFPSVVFLEDA